MRISLAINVNWVTFLIGMNILLFMIPVILGVLLQGQVDDPFGALIFLMGGVRADIVLIGMQWWRLVTASFLHWDILHLGMNMYTLWQLGTLVREYYGGKMLFSFYTFCGIGGGVLSVLMGSNALTVGASGAVFGLLGVLISGSMKWNRFGMDLPIGLWDIMPLAVYAFLIGILPGFAVNNWVHLGGFLVGMVFGQIAQHKLTVAPSKLQLRLESFLFYSSVVITIISFAVMLITIPFVLQLGI